MAFLKLNNGKEISDYGNPYIIAELGSNHNGDMEIARKLIVAAKKAGCDCVKFQSWSKSTIFSKQVYQDNYFLRDDYRNRTDYTLEEIVDTFSISETELYDMYQLCLENEIDFTSTPFSKKEVDFLVDICHVPFVKVASMDLNNYGFLEYIAAKQVPIILSTGLSELFEIDKAVRTIEQAGNRQISLLHCISIYPPKFEDINLNNIVGLRNTYPEYPIGFSDHSLGIEIPLSAVALGSCCIEKHFTLDKNMFGWDHKVSANPEEMAQLVQCAHNVNMALGSTRRVVCEDELIKRDAFRRSIVAATDIDKNQIITEECLDVKRPGTGLSPELLPFLIGKRATRKICFDEIIEKDDIT